MHFDLVSWVYTSVNRFGVTANRLLWHKQLLGWKLDLQMQRMLSASVHTSSCMQLLASIITRRRGWYTSCLCVECQRLAYVSSRGVNACKCTYLKNVERDCELLLWCHTEYICSIKRQHQQNARLNIDYQHAAVTLSARIIFNHQMIQLCSMSLSHVTCVPNCKVWAAGACRDRTQQDTAAKLSSAACSRCRCSMHVRKCSLNRSTYLPMSQDILPRV